MLFHIVGRFRLGSRAKQKAAEFLLKGEPSLTIRLASDLRNAKGEETGFAALLEAESVSEIERFIKANPDLCSNRFDLAISEFNPVFGHLSWHPPIGDLLLFSTIFASSSPRRSGLRGVATGVVWR